MPNYSCSYHYIVSQIPILPYSATLLVTFNRRTCVINYIAAACLVQVKSHEPGTFVDNLSLVQQQSNVGSASPGSTLLVNLHHFTVIHGSPNLKMLCKTMTQRNHTSSTRLFRTKLISDSGHICLMLISTTL